MSRIYGGTISFKQICSAKAWLITVLLSFWCPVSYSNQYPEEKTIPDYLERGDYANAFLQMIELKKKKPSAELLLMMAKTQEKLQNFSIAAIHYEELLRTFPNSEYDIIARSRLRNYLRLYRDDDMLVLKPKTESIIEEGLKAMKDNDYHQAILLFLQARKRNDQNYLVNFNLGLAYYRYYEQFMKDGYLDKSIAYFIKASKLNSSPKVLNLVVILWVHSRCCCQD
jgi:tetratricopeptide (TPR) repeat protein